MKTKKGKLMLERIKTIPKNAKIIGTIFENKEGYFFQLNLGSKK